MSTSSDSKMFLISSVSLRTIASTRAVNGEYGHEEKSGNSEQWMLGNANGVRCFKVLSVLIITLRRN